MKLSRKLKNRKAGFVFIIDIKLKSGETIDMSMLSKDIGIDGGNYKPDKNYCDIIREIYDRLSEKYEIKGA